MSVFVSSSLGGLSFAGDPSKTDIDFARDIQPNFAKHCIRCHGAKKQESGYRLDRKEAAQAGGDSGKRAIVPGKPAESRLLQLVRGDNPDLVMPPDGDELTKAEIDLITRWIAAGAPRPDDQPATATTHWSFIAPKRPPVPQIRNPKFDIRNPIDAFVAARLEKEGLPQSPPADKATLLRRVSLDLIGLPPTLAEIDEFEHDSRPDAYERLVDRLLASPHYGERWARKWLDLARYADTNGYEKDRARSIWPYRDWVINALNADMPFDQFTIEQIAGDLLPDATLSQRIATGFHRNTMINEEGGIDVEEFRFHSLVDRVGTTGTVWLGLTIACAQCHSHKYDPITQREFYGLFAFLNNADEPETDVPQPDVAARRAEIEREIAAREAELEKQFPLPHADPRPEGDGTAVARAKHLEAKFLEWQQAALAKSHRWTIVKPSRVVSRGKATMTVLPDGSVLVSGDKPNRDIYDIELQTDLPAVTALRLEVLPHDSLPDSGPGRAPLFAVGDFLLSEVAVAADALRPVKIAAASHSHAGKDRSATLCIDGDLDTGWGIGGRTGEEHHAVFALVEPAERTGSPSPPAPLPRGERGEGASLIVTLNQHYIHQTTIGRFRLSITSDPLPVASSGLPANVEAILVTPAARRTADQVARLKRYFLATTPELAEQQKQIAELRKKLPRQPTTMVMQERLPEHARTTHRHQRGEFLKSMEPVTPAVPAVLHSLPKDAPLNRLTLARWLVDPANPLVGRVVMNRQWEAFFGRGLVRTSEDFGTQGSPPTHPELLDWLACEFVNPIDFSPLPTGGEGSGVRGPNAASRPWSLKRMHRLIVTSATYRQSSRVPPELLTRDPQNELLARGPRLRLEAEQVRDAALVVSGLLNRKLGGPSVYPPQPPGVTELAYGKPTWPTSTGPERYRRGLYTYAKRTSPYATFSLFDAPSGEASCPRRNRSNTPLQALTLLNDPVYLEAAQALGRRIVKEAPADIAGRIDFAFGAMLGRRPTGDEVASVTEFHSRLIERFHTSEDDAAKVAGVKLEQRPQGIDLPELASWAVVARVLLNLDEFVTRE